MAVREGLLALLADEPAYGYQLKQGFEAATGGLWPLNVGQVYSTLDRLERDGLVESLERDDQKIYQITDAGREVLTAWWELGATENPPPRDELLLKVMVAAAQSIDHGLDIVTRQRSAVLASLQRRQHGARLRAKHDFWTTAAHDALVVRAEADVRWLDMCEERLITAQRDAVSTKGGRQ